jgi:AcrR family transcriptional regulator
MSTATTRRHTAEERRDEIIEAAMAEFALGGLHGTSTEAIARRAGVSQPYLFRLFGTKKDLFLAAVERVFDRTTETFERAIVGVDPDRAMPAMGRAYGDLLKDRTLLLVQLHAHAACEDPGVRVVVRRRFADLYRFVAKVTGADTPALRQFFATGMLMNVAAAMDLAEVQEDWALGCMWERP